MDLNTRVRLAQVERVKVTDAIDRLSLFCRNEAETLLLFQELGEVVARRAKLQGVVMTMEQKPLKPLAMGHEVTVVRVRRARGGY